MGTAPSFRRSEGQTLSFYGTASRLPPGFAATAEREKRSPSQRHSIRTKALGPSPYSSSLRQPVVSRHCPHDQADGGKIQRRRPSDLWASGIFRHRRPLRGTDCVPHRRQNQCVPTPKTIGRRIDSISVALRHILGLSRSSMVGLCSLKRREWTLCDLLSIRGVARCWKSPHFQSNSGGVWWQRNVRRLR